MTGLIAIIRVRGSAETKRPVEDTLKMLNLTRVNHCVVKKKTPALDGMLRKASGNITWGPINGETLEKLVAKRGRLVQGRGHGSSQSGRGGGSFYGGKKLDEKQAKGAVKGMLAGDKPAIKKVFRLHPPSGGYRAIKKPYPEGDLGSRGEKINELLKKMI